MLWQQRKTYDEVCRTKSELVQLVPPSHLYVFYLRLCLDSGTGLYSNNLAQSLAYWLTFLTITPHSTVHTRPDHHQPIMNRNRTDVTEKSNIYVFCSKMMKFTGKDWGWEFECLGRFYTSHPAGIILRGFVVVISHSKHNDKLER